MLGFKKKPKIDEFLYAIQMHYKFLQEIRDEIKTLHDYVHRKNHCSLCDQWKINVLQLCNQCITDIKRIDK